LRHDLQQRMRPRSTRSDLALVFCLTGALVGCGHTSAIESRFRSEFNCGSVSVRSIGGSSYIAEGCGARATYTCTTDRPSGWGGNSAWGVSSCSRESVADNTLPAVRATSSYVPPRVRQEKQAERGSVERSFDEKRGIHVIKAKFKPPSLDADILLVGAPEHELTVVYVHALVRGNQKPWEGCNSLRTLVNAQPFPGEGTEFEQRVKRRMMMRASGRFHFEQFKPLARKYADFGVELCGQRLGFAQEQMPNVLKFLEMFSQVAMDAQSKGNAIGESATIPAPSAALPVASDAGVQR
jgi:hypothetical protein